MANAADWAERVAEWRASGVTAAQFCAGRDYAARTLLRWSSELRVTPTIELARVEPDAAKRPEIRLARVVRARGPTTLPPTRTPPMLRAPVVIPGAAIVVVVDGARVEVGRGASREVLSMVLDALAERSCG